MHEQLSRPEQDLQETMDQLLAPQPIVIGIEGGPCSGKTTLVERLATEALQADRPLVVLPEAATQHIARLDAAGLSVADLAVNDRAAYVSFEADVLRTIVEQITEARQRYAGQYAIIVADRVDIGAYLTTEEYQQVLEQLGLNTVPLLSMVDQLYYLPTLARTNQERYETLKSTNPARYETADQAVATCEANLQAVRSHPEIHLLWGGDFTDTIARASRAILAADIESEVKLSGSARDIANSIRLAHKDGRMLPKQDITQSYHRLADQPFRLRKVVTAEGDSVHYFTVKHGQGIARRELQRIISGDTYDQLLSVERQGGIVHKQRYQFLERDLTHDPRTGEAERLRQWSADWYPHPSLLRFDMETDVESEQEANDLERTYLYLARAAMSAADLALRVV